MYQNQNQNPNQTDNQQKQRLHDRDQVNMGNDAQKKPTQAGSKNPASTQGRDTPTTAQQQQGRAQDQNEQRGSNKH
jgi:hypothetical protein